MAAICVWRASTGGTDHLLRMIPLLIFMLALIWFGKYLEHYRGWAGYRIVTQASPGVLIQAMGWVLMVLCLFLAEIGNQAGP